MTLNNRTFTLLKIVLLIIISIFIAEIIVLPKIEHDMLQEAGRQELVTVQQICGAVLENYPDVEQDFILGLRQPTNSLQEKGEQILKQYGYDEEHLLADNTLYAAYMIAWRNWTGFFLVTTFLLLAAALLYFYSTIRSPRNSHITISIEKQHFYTLVKIKDEGIGIPQNEYNKIFQRFYRSNHSYVKQTEGSGVGLYLTRMILERQGGLIRVESVPEKGSTFILQFRN